MAGLLIVAALFRFVLLGRTPLWADEVFSVLWSRLDVAYLLGPGARLETNPPAFYVMLKAWIGLFGSSNFAVRALPALAATVTVPVAYLIGRRLGGRSFAVVAGLFLALSPDMLGLARQARGYALLALCCTVALLALVEALRQDARRRGAAILLFALAASGSVLFHYTSVFFIAACFVAVAVRLLVTPGMLTRGAVLSWLAAAALVAVLTAAPLLTAASMSQSANIAWIQPLSLERIWMFFREVFIGNARPGLFPNALCVVLIAATCVGAARGRLSPVASVVLVVVPLTFLALLLGVSVWRPLFIARTGAWLTTPIALLQACFAFGFTSRAWRLVAGTTVLVILGSLASRVPTRPAIEDWRATAQVVATDRRCAGPVVTIGPHVMDLEYVAPELAARPRYWVPLLPGQTGTAEAALQRQVSSAIPLDPVAFGSFIEAHPGAVVLLRYGLDEAGKALMGDATARMAVTDERPGIMIYCR